MKLRTLLAWALCALLLLPAAGADAAAENWSELLKDFKTKWKDQFKGRWNLKPLPPDPADNRGEDPEKKQREGESDKDYKERMKELRRQRQKKARKEQRDHRIDKVERQMKKRSRVLAILGTSADGRAVKELLGAHKKQLRYLKEKRKEWEERDEDIRKRLPQMTAALELAQKSAAPDGTYRVSVGVKKFFEKEKPAVEQLYYMLTLEGRVSELIRKNMAQVMNAIQDKERDKALKAVVKAAGKGADAEQREFIRVLGYMKGDDVTEVLVKFANDVQPLVITAALEALGRQNSPGAMEVLKARLKDPRWQIRAAAVEGLGFYRDAKAVELLLDHLEKADGVVQRHYFAALARLFGKSPGTNVTDFRKHWNEKKAEIEKAWAESPTDGPVKVPPPPVMVKGKSDGYGFYGIKTESKHIIFVVDVSGSMGPEHGGVNKEGLSRLQVLKKQLKQAINQLTATESDERGVASFNIVTYHADVVVYKPGKMVPATKKNKEKAIEWIEELKADGATNIYDALEQAFLIIDTRKAKKQYEKGADTIFLMTDGQPNRGKIVDTELIRQEVRKLNRDRKFTIHTIGVGKDHEVEFLKGLAAENAGEYLAKE